eukprot:3358461-Alexandrium_andersonii.AAC.1
MSASLVGSEMCIRDRGQTALSIARDSAKVGAPAFKRRVSQEPRFARCPVSYTHLTLPTICSV